MKLVFLESAAQDLQWVRQYYRSVFPQGAENAQARIKATIRTLSANPYAGHRNGTWPDVREFSISRTPFVVIYRVTDTQIEVLRFWDSRRGTDF